MENVNSPKGYNQKRINVQTDWHCTGVSHVEVVMFENQTKFVYLTH